MNSTRKSIIITSVLFLCTFKPVKSAALWTGKVNINDEAIPKIKGLINDLEQAGTRLICKVQDVAGLLKARVFTDIQKELERNIAIIVQHKLKPDEGDQKSAAASTQNTLQETFDADSFNEYIIKKFKEIESFYPKDPQILNIKKIFSTTIADLRKLDKENYEQQMAILQPLKVMLEKTIQDLNKESLLSKEAMTKNFEILQGKLNDVASYLSTTLRTELTHNLDQLALNLQDILGYPAIETFHSKLSDFQLTIKTESVKNIQDGLNKYIDELGAIINLINRVTDTQESSQAKPIQKLTEPRKSDADQKKSADIPVKLISKMSKELSIIYHQLSRARDDFNSGIPTESKRGDQVAGTIPDKDVRNILSAELNEIIDTLAQILTTQNGLQGTLSEATNHIQKITERMSDELSKLPAQFKRQMNQTVGFDLLVNKIPEALHAIIEMERTEEALNLKIRRIQEKFVTTLAFVDELLKMLRMDITEPSEDNLYNSLCIFKLSIEEQNRILQEGSAEIAPGRPTINWPAIRKLQDDFDVIIGKHGGLAAVNKATVAALNPVVDRMNAGFENALNHSIPRVSKQSADYAIPKCVGLACCGALGLYSVVFLMNNYENPTKFKIGLGTLTASLAGLPLINKLVNRWYAPQEGQ